MLDEHGLPVPSKKSPLPWAERECGCCFVDLNGVSVYDDNCGFELAKDRNFSIHAANWIIPCREIVRRLAEWSASYSDPLDTIDAKEIGLDAAKLWTKMQEEAKGGNDNVG